MVIRAYSLMEPWASAVAWGLKGIETRDHDLSHRGPLAIHASKTKDRESRAFFDEVRPYFRMAGYLGSYEDLPFGRVVCLTNMTDSRPTEVLENLVNHVGEIELLFGNFTPGRRGYLLQDVRRLITPVPAKGWPGLWTWEPEEEPATVAPTWKPKGGT
jgi:hypothetical protein